MITREKDSRNVVFNCDGCSEVLNTETSNFTDALRDVKKEKWRIQKDKDEWIHWCPVCTDR